MQYGVLTACTTADVVGAMIPSKPLSYRRAKVQSNPNTVRRIHHYVNHHIFKLCKFLTNESMVTKAVQSVMVGEFQMQDESALHDPQFARFYGKYRSTMMDAINTKRGTCAQLGGKSMEGMW